MSIHQKTNMEGQSVAGVNILLDEAMVTNALKNDAALSRFLHVAPPVLSKLRHGNLVMGPSMILRLHELAGLEVAYVRQKLESK